MFAAGLLFYELLTGQPAVRGENIEVMNRIANQDIRLPKNDGVDIDDARQHSLQGDGPRSAATPYLGLADARGARRLSSAGRTG